jgi:hypothetical protein
MMKLKRLLAAAMLVTACRATNQQIADHPDASTTGPQPDARINLPGPDAPPGASGSIRALNMSPPAANTSVSLGGVVTVGRVTSSSNATAWVQDPGGGPYSGIQLFCPKSSCSAYDTIDKLAAGEVLDVTGTYDVFQGSPELKGVTITKKGTTTAPVATTLTAEMLAKGTDSTSPAFVQWNEVLVRLAGPLTATNVTAPQFSAACSGGNGDAGAGSVQYRGFEVTIGHAVVNVGLGFFDTLHYCLPGCGFACNDEVKAGDGFDSIQGVARVLDGFVRVDPATNEDMPREGETPTADAGAADVPMSMPDGPTSPGPDAPAATADAPVLTSDAGGVIVGDGTVKSITMELPADGSLVALKDVVVVGNELRTSGSQVYVQDQGGGQYSGLFVFCNTNTCKPSFQNLQPGDVVDVQGTFKNFKSGTANTPELGEPLTVTVKATTHPVVAADVPASVLGLAPDSPDFKPYNGVYVRVNSAATVTSAHVTEFDSGSCTGGNKFFNAFEASVGADKVNVFAFFNDSLGRCIAGGCATCNSPVAMADSYNFARGVARWEKKSGAPTVVLSPVEDIDIPRAGSARAVLATPPSTNAAVTLSGVVVVAHNARVGGTSANLYVQDPGGGRYSGIQVFCQTSAAATCVTDILALSPGDVINVTGKYSVFQSFNPEVIAPAIVKAGATATVVAASVLPADAVRPDGGFAAGSTAVMSNHFAPYNQVLVKVDGPVSVTATMVDPDLVGTCTGNMMDWRGFSASMAATSVYVGDLFAPAGFSLCEVDQCDTKTCATGDMVNMTDTFASVMGVARFSKNNKLQLAPRSNADIPRATP